MLSKGNGRCNLPIEELSVAGLDLAVIVFVRWLVKWMPLGGNDITELRLNRRSQFVLFKRLA